MSHLIFLPASGPGDEGFDLVTRECALLPGTTVHKVRYPTMVWYNEAVCREAVRQIVEWKLEQVVLIGFSKSGLGAWNIARLIPGSVAATVIFDAPATRDVLPPWETEDFYENDVAWQGDQPIHSIESFASRVNPGHQLILISGELFHGEMEQLARALAGSGIRHKFLHRPELRHQWQSGWIGEALGCLDGAFGK